MRCLALAAVALVVAVGPGWSAAKLDNIEVTAGRVNPGSVAASGTFTVHNRGSSAISRLYVTCALLEDNDSPKDVNDQQVTDIGPGQTVFGSMYFTHAASGGKLTCRASDVR